MTYNYIEAMTEDVKNYINEEIDRQEWTDDREGLEEHLNDTLWTEDSVTGNGSGSYTFNGYKAKEYVTDNVDDCAEALREFCVDPETIAEKFLHEEWEYFDVTIRCYYLGSVVYDVCEELEAEGYFNAEETETAGELIAKGITAALDNMADALTPTSEPVPAHA